MNIDQIVNEIKQNGYYIIKNYYSKEQCKSIINDVQNTKQHQFQAGEGNDLRMPFFESLSTGAHNFLNDTTLLKIGTKLLGHQVDKIKKRCQLGVLQFNDNDKSSGGGWHVDNHNPQFKALLYLTDVNINNGPFAMISPPLLSKDYTSISQNKNTRFPDKISEDYKKNIHYLTGNSGDVIVVNTQYIHRGTIIKEGERISLTNYYYDNK